MKQNNQDKFEVPASSSVWMKDSSGFPSVTITFLFVSFWVTTLAYVLSIFQKIGPLEIRSFDVGACSSYFGIIVGGYIARRYTDARWGNPNIPTSTTTSTTVTSNSEEPQTVVQNTTISRDGLQVHSPQSQEATLLKG